MPDKPKTVPPQAQQHQPGREAEMVPQPQDRAEDYRGSGKLAGKVALVTGGDSGIGRSVAVHFAKEGADVAIVYLEEHEDAELTQSLVEKEGRTAILVAGDVGDSRFCNDAVKRTIDAFGRLDVLVNNAGEQHLVERLEEIEDAQIERTFRTNILAYFFMARAALPHLKEGATIVNTTSVTAYKGSPHLIDYASTKGAIVSFTRSLAMQLAERDIRVNAVAPGPIWTPLIPASYPPEQVAKHGTHAKLGRPGQPDEVAPSFVFLASNDASYMTGQVLHPNGGEVI
jgi:NAD(P)-dependent dehydrogenase (short-subunit alcohol dehydrogenase family)